MWSQGCGASWANNQHGERRHGASLEQSNDQRKQVAVTVAREWVELADAGRFGECWETCAAFAKSQITKEQTIELYNGIRKPLGTPQAPDIAVGQLVSAAARWSRPVNTSSFNSIRIFPATGKQLEQVTLFWDEDQSWRIAGYHVSADSRQQHDPVTEQKKQALSPPRLSGLSRCHAGIYGEALGRHGPESTRTVLANRESGSTQYNELFQPLGPMKSRDLRTR